MAGGRRVACDMTCFMCLDRHHWDWHAIPDQWTWEVLALLAMLFFFRFLVYVALRIRTKAKVR